MDQNQERKEVSVSKFLEQWLVVKGETAYYPVAIASQNGNTPLIDFHSWDSTGPQKAQALVTLHNAFLLPGGVSYEELRSALAHLPAGPWIVTEAHLSYPTTVGCANGLTQIVSMGFHGDSDLALANHLLDIERKAVAVLAERKVLGLKPDVEGAQLFFEELLESVETLGGIAEQYGIRTLTELMYLQQAILKGETIEVWPGETEVGKVLQMLPSAIRWMQHTELGGDWKHACERVGSLLPGM